MRGSTFRRFLQTALAVGVVFSDAGAVQAQVVKFREAIPFYAARLVGYEKVVELRMGSRVVRPSAADRVFVTIKLEISAPFEYRRGMFREISLLDENGRSYQYNGFLMEQGWHALDDATPAKPGDVMLTISADAYPKQVDVHFEVPVTVSTLTMRFGNRTLVLFAPPK